MGLEFSVNPRNPMYVVDQPMLSVDRIQRISKILTETIFLFKTQNSCVPGLHPSQAVAREHCAISKSRVRPPNYLSRISCVPGRQHGQDVEWIYYRDVDLGANIPTLPVYPVYRPLGMPTGYTAN